MSTPTALLLEQPWADDPHWKAYVTGALFPRLGFEAAAAAAETETASSTKNKIKDKFRHRRESERFEGAVARISGSRAPVKNYIAKAKALKTEWYGRCEIEGQIRTVKKALLYCDGIVDLAERTTSERLACKQLVVELEDTKCFFWAARTIHGFVGPSRTQRISQKPKKP
ncbi:hypothetical protein MMYC01_202899 [Madurella mycetomatis]|uniref:Uncharacterized protein n=1 Tax=Madurella mycetomatis TaxID=100816 RepID=A0A175W9G5_9PEZI|nr:hypothetical protein MMYC01_202899 [Madurella mycetomatis]